MAESANTATCGTAEAHVEQQLIPGIPNEITLGQISSKLRRRDIDKSLVLVSRGWYHAIRSRQVYDARVRSNSTEMFILSVNRPRVPPGTWEYARDDIPENRMTLWDITDLCSNLELPSLPSNYFDTVIPGRGRCATFDGRIYVFGGLDCKVHVLDVAGHRQWKQCASMLYPKHEFGCGVIDGKIYVFGGAIHHDVMSATDLYNPRRDTWSPIRPIVALRCGDHIARVKREFVMQNGEPEFYLNFTRPYRHIHVHQLPDPNSSLLEVYDPFNDEWRVVEPVGSPKEKLFVAGGKFYSMSPLGIHVYDFHLNSWVARYSFSFNTIGQADPVELWPLGIFTDHSDRGELLALIDWPTAGRGANRSCLMQSRGLRSQDNVIAWQNADFSTPFTRRIGTVYLGENPIKL